MKKHLLLLLTLLFCFVGQAWGATYYVNSGGSDTSPYDTEAKAATQVETIFDLDLAVGSLIEMTSDITESDGLVTIDSNDSGDSSNQVIFDLNGNTLTGRVYFDDCGYVTIQNGTVTGSDSDYAIGLYGNAFGSEPTGNIVQDMTVSGNDRSGIIVRYQTSPIVRRITISGNGTAGANNHDGIYVGQNTTGFTLQDITVSGQKSDNGTPFDFSSTDADGNAETISGTIERCKAVDNDSGSSAIKIAIGDTDPDEADITIQNCLFKHSDTGTFVFNTSGTLSFYNNYMESTNHNCTVRTGSHVITWNFKNNICLVNGGYPHRLNDVTDLTSDFDNNSYYDQDGSLSFYWDSGAVNLSTWQTNIGGDTNSLTADPRLDTTYCPKLRSPVIDAGTVIYVAEDDCADDDTGDWDTTMLGSTLAFDTDHYTLTDAGSGSAFMPTSVVAGHTYRISVQIKDGTASGIDTSLAAFQVVTTTSTNASWQTLTGNWSCTSDDNEGWFGVFTGNLSGDNIELKNFTVQDLSATDYYGRTRIIGSGPDIGACESRYNRRRHRLLRHLRRYR